MAKARQGKHAATAPSQGSAEKSKGRTALAVPQAPPPKGPTAEQRKTSRRKAFIAVLCMALFSCLYLGAGYVVAATFPDRQIDQPQAAVPFDVAESQTEQLTDPFYVLLIGSDSRKGTALYTGKPTDGSQVDQRSDIMTLMRVDPQTYQITLVTIPRDTQLVGSPVKINESLTGNDPMQVVAAVERLCGVEVDYYMMTTFAGFEGLVNALGGVVVDVPLTITVADPLTAMPVTVEAGDDQRLDGAQALVFARARKEYVDYQDVFRQQNVRTLEETMIEQVLGENSSSKLAGAFDDLREFTETNIDLESAAQLGLDFMKHRDEMVVYSCSGPYDGGENESGMWVVPEDPETWAELMSAVDAGEDPTGIVPLPVLEKQ